MIAFQMAVALQVSFIVFLTFAIILKTCFIIVLWTYYVQLSLEKDMNVTKKTTELEELLGEGDDIPDL
jgi:hypothetical protein